MNNRKIIGKLNAPNRIKILRFWNLSDNLPHIGGNIKDDKGRRVTIT